MAHTILKNLNTEIEEFCELLSQYVWETLTSVEIVQEFCDRQPKWFLQREMELDMMRDIKERLDKIDLKFDHVQKAEDKAKAFGEYVWSGLTQVTADSRRQALEKELGAVLEQTLEGLKKLHLFLDAVEILAVTSLFVFTEDSFLPKGVSAASMRSVISAARLASPLLIHFKRDPAAFFSPFLSNVEVLAFHLDKYMHISQQLCERMEKRSEQVFKCDLTTNHIIFWKGKNGHPKLKINLEMSDEPVQKMLDHLKQLNHIRMDQDFRITFLFQEKALNFIGLFNLRYERMLKFLSELEESAEQLDKMKKGASISSVAGSSVGVAGGVLSIVGLALTPVTAGVSLALTLTGVGLGVTSGVNSVVTGITELAVNSRHGKNANAVFQKYMEDVQTLQDFLEQVANGEGPAVDSDLVNVVLGAGKVVARAGAVAKGVDSIVDAASAVKVLKSEQVIQSAAKMGLQEAKATRNIPNLAADLPDIGQLAKGTPLAMSKSARSGFIALNALFIGLDVLFICKDSVSLAKGSKSEVSELIRSRVALWCSELESWKKVNDSLCRGIWRFRKCQWILEEKFHP
ncbi:apolipoprotein L1-like [Chanos chanos]|uniref:Apolipoprotein L1-like n=1 Tax=Chanos chanos TaxID=29144 RepID=A0A6J2UX54_CHACN|nr:apolipoprotein L1-like [Chanos chanos]